MAYVDAAVRRPQLIAAARRAFARDGVAKTSLRAVATEAGVPLGTLQHVFPAKEQLLRAVIEDVASEIADVIGSAAEREHGLAHALRQGVTAFWSTLVSGSRGLQVMQYELTLHALRSPGQADLARWQYDRYVSVIEEWCRDAAERAGETCAVPFRQLARVILAGVDGLILQNVCDPDDRRSRDDLEAVIDGAIALAGVREAGRA